jgi:hypothetical protein
MRRSSSVAAVDQEVVLTQHGILTMPAVTSQVKELLAKATTVQLAAVELHRAAVADMELLQLIHRVAQAPHLHFSLRR